MPRAAPTWGALLRRDRVYSTAGRPQIRLFGGHARDETEHAIHWASEAAHRFIAEYIAAFIFQLSKPKLMWLLVPAYQAVVGRIERMELARKFKSGLEWMLPLPAIDDEQTAMFVFSHRR